MYYATTTFRNLSKKSNNKKRKIEEIVVEEQPQIALNDLEEEIPFLFSKDSSKKLYTLNNNIFFNDDITADTMFNLTRELRQMDNKQATFAMINKTEPSPIYLYLTTNGGEIYSAFTAVDCIKSLKCPVYTVVDGFVASAGTLLSLAGKKRYIQPNAYMLFHELRSGMWGKMTDIDQEYCNVKKIMKHLIQYYTENTSISASQLEKQLKKDDLWSASECLKKGVVDEYAKF
jgi:ATP-dependent Clp endopeptidase proteolytic subunit ClpP